MMLVTLSAVRSFGLSRGLSLAAADEWTSGRSHQTKRTFTYSRTGPLGAAAAAAVAPQQQQQLQHRRQTVRVMSSEFQGMSYGSQAGSQHPSIELSVCIDILHACIASHHQHCPGSRALQSAVCLTPQRIAWRPSSTLIANRKQSVGGARYDAGRSAHRTFPTGTRCGLQCCVQPYSVLIYCARSRKSIICLGRAGLQSPSVTHSLNLANAIYAMEWLCHVERPLELGMHS